MQKKGSNVGLEATVKAQFTCNEPEGGGAQFKPNIVEKKVEVEVEKIVEKIVEKPVIQEKIIEKEIEVPKQIEKKVFVHVPFPTDDPEVIKKGPMIYNDNDKDKKK